MELPKRALGFLSRNRKTLFFLFLIFLLAFGIRGHLLKYELFFEFDSYYHARLISYLIQDGSLPEHDPLAYYQLGGATLPATGAFFWYFNAFVYKLFTLNGAYDKQLWIDMVKVLPAFYGALISVLMYFLGKELYGKKAGYTMAFFAAVVPAFVYRTMAGFFEEDSFGFVWMISGLIFFFKAVKEPEFTRKKILFSALSGLLFGIMAWTWNMFILVPILLLLYFPFAVLNLKSKRSGRELLDFVKLFAIGFGVFVLIALAVSGPGWINTTVNYVLGVLPPNIPLPLLGFGIALLAMLAYIVSLTGKKSSESSSKTLSFVSIAAMFAALLVVITIFAVIPDYRGQGVLERTVGEESTGKESFGSKYGPMVVLPLIALLLLPLRVYRRSDEHYSSLVFFWLLVTLFMAWYKLKFTYTFGLPVAVGAGVVVAETFSFLQNRKEISTRFVAVCLALFFLAGIATATIFVIRYAPNIETDMGWKPALEWMQNNTPEDAKFFNWWDQGHWITFVGERKAFLDNRNADYYGDRDFALFAISTDLEKSMEIIKKYGPDYLILSWDSLASTVSYGFYAFDTTNPDHPEIQKFYVGPTAAFPCGASQSENTVFFQCEGNRLSEAEMSSIPTTWQAVPAQLIEDRIPLFVYTDKDKAVLYLLNAMVNQTTMAKVWFNHTDSQKYFEEVYSAQGVKIFKIKK